jgi:hypothetical protein
MSLLLAYPYKLVAPRCIIVYTYSACFTSPSINPSNSNFEGKHLDSGFDSISVGVPPKSPDHSDVHTSRISIQTHPEAHSLRMSEDVWHCRHAPERSASGLGLPQRVDTGADRLLPTERVFCKAFCIRVLGWLARSRHADGGSDIEQALHIHMATVLSPSVGMMDQPS